MSVPQRPQHVVTRRQQLLAWRDRLFERLRAARSAPLPEFTGEAVDDVRSPPRTSMVPGVLVGAAMAVLGLAAVWGWQAWSERVSLPIDERLPMLVTSANTQDDGPAATAAPVPASVVGVGPTAGPDPLPSPAIGTETAESKRVIVHVAGAVVQPGVVTVELGARVIDALEQAGGPSPEADLDRVNLAALLIDGERIHVPAFGEDQLPTVVAPDRSSGIAVPNNLQPNTEPEPILDINLATAEALEALPGIGPSIAQAIVQTRVNRGPFLTVEEMLGVPGIGEAKLAQIEPHVRVGP